MLLRDAATRRRGLPMLPSSGYFCAAARGRAWERLPLARISPLSFPQVPRRGWDVQCVELGILPRSVRPVLLAGSFEFSKLAAYATKR